MMASMRPCAAMAHWNSFLVAFLAVCHTLKEVRWRTQCS